MSKIVIGVDESERSRDAIAFGRTLAEASGAPVVLVAAYPFQAGWPSYEYDQYLKQDTEALLARVAKELEGLPGVTTRTFADPSPASALMEVAREEDAALIVVGSTHTGHLGRVLPGSTAERLLHGSPCPVAVVPRGYAAAGPHTVRTIVAAWDGGPESEAALAAAEELAKTTVAELRVVRVHAPEYYAYPPALGAGYAQLLDEMRDQAREQLDARVARIDSHVRAEAQLIEGDPCRDLAGVSGTADLLVMGSRRYGPLRAVLLGGVSGKVLRSAECPVIVIPRGARQAVAPVFAAAVADGS